MTGGKCLYLLRYLVVSVNILELCSGTQFFLRFSKCLIALPCEVILCVSEEQDLVVLCGVQVSSPDRTADSLLSGVFLTCMCMGHSLAKTWLAGWLAGKPLSVFCCYNSVPQPE